MKYISSLFFFFFVDCFSLGMNSYKVLEKSAFYLNSLDIPNNIKFKHYNTDTYLKKDVKSAGTIDSNYYTNLLNNGFEQILLQSLKLNPFAITNDNKFNNLITIIYNLNNRENGFARIEARLKLNRITADKTLQPAFNDFRNVINPLLFDDKGTLTNFDYYQKIDGYITSFFNDIIKITSIDLNKHNQIKEITQRYKNVQSKNNTPSDSKFNTAIFNNYDNKRFLDFIEKLKKGEEASGYIIGKNQNIFEKIKSFSEEQVGKTISSLMKFDPLYKTVDFHRLDPQQRETIKEKVILRYELKSELEKYFKVSPSHSNVVEEILYKFVDFLPNKLHKVYEFLFSLNKEENKQNNEIYEAFFHQNGILNLYSDKIKNNEIDLSDQQYSKQRYLIHRLLITEPFKPTIDTVISYISNSIRYPETAKYYEIAIEEIIRKREKPVETPNVINPQNSENMLKAKFTKEEIEFLLSKDASFTLKSAAVTFAKTFNLDLEKLLMSYEDIPQSVTQMYIIGELNKLSDLHNKYITIPHILEGTGLAAKMLDIANESNFENNISLATRALGVSKEIYRILSYSVQFATGFVIRTAADTIKSSADVIAAALNEIFFNIPSHPIDRPIVLVNKAIDFNRKIRELDDLIENSMVAFLTDSVFRDEIKKEIDIYVANTYEKLTLLSPYEAGYTVGALGQFLVPFIPAKYLAKPIKLIFSEALESIQSQAIKERLLSYLNKNKFILNFFQDEKINEGIVKEVAKIFGEAEKQSLTTGFNVVTKNGINVNGFTEHAVDRAIGDTYKRLGVKPGAILDALKNAIKIETPKIDVMGRASQRFIGRLAEVVVNPDTGKIISFNPVSSDKVKKILSKMGDLL